MMSFVIGVKKSMGGTVSEYWLCYNAENLPCESMPISKLYAKPLQIDKAFGIKDCPSKKVAVGMTLF